MDTITPRRGPRPATTCDIPHSQIDQQPDTRQLMDRVLDEALTWDGVSEAESGISVEGARALILTPEFAIGPTEAFFVGTEFAHGHAHGDYSFHVTLPTSLATAAQEAGWAEPHILVATGQVPATFVMLYAPRDDDEARLLAALVRRSYEFATNAPAGRRPLTLTSDTLGASS
ncbi:luciferase domain-containing protein [Gordonia sp. NPDC003424]